MAYLKTQMDLLTTHLLLGNIEKVKVVGSHSGGAEYNSEEEANYLNN